MKHIQIFDTSLRDGSQAPGCGLYMEEKIRLAKYLAEIGTDVIEAGFPISSNVEFESIDSFGIDGDYIESQAFAFLAIRSILNLPLSFPTTTGCNKPCVGGNVI